MTGQLTDDVLRTLPANPDQQRCEQARQRDLENLIPWYCTRAVNHAGPHVAHGHYWDRLVVMVAWTDDGEYREF